MFKYFVVFAFAALWSVSANENLVDLQSIVDDKIDLEAASRNNLRALAGGISDKLAEFIEKVLALPDYADKQRFLEPAEILIAAAEDMQNSLFNVDSSVSLTEMYRIQHEVDQLFILLDDYIKNFINTTTMYPITYKPPTTASSTVIETKKTIEMICSEVDRSKVEILSYPAEECSGHKLLSNLTDCQSLCTSIKPYFYELINSQPSVAIQAKAHNQLRRCQAIVDIWRLLRNIQPDRPTLDQTCSNIGALGVDINKFPIPQCDKDPFLKDQKTLFTICARLQRDYTFIDPANLLETYKDLVDKLNELGFRWESYKASAIIKPKPTRPYPIYPTAAPYPIYQTPAPIQIYPTAAPTINKPYNPAIYSFGWQARANSEAVKPGQYTSVFKPLIKA